MVKYEHTVSHGNGHHFYGSGIGSYGKSIFMVKINILPLNANIIVTMRKDNHEVEPCKDEVAF